MNGTISAAQAPAIQPLRDFVVAVTHLVDQMTVEAELVAAVRAELIRLIADDAWLPAEAAAPHPDHYQQYLLHCDPLERFCIVSFVWGPGQRTPVHDHRVWGLVGVLRGGETSQAYARGADGRLHEQGPEEHLAPGDIALVSPRTGDVHRVANACADRASISIHVYGGNIGAVARHVFDPDTAQAKPFVSGYSNAATPNLWDRSAQVRSTLAILSTPAA